MKIVFNYNNSDFPCPSSAPLFSPVSVLFHPAILYRIKYHLKHRQPSDPQPFPPLHTIFSS